MIFDSIFFKGMKINKTASIYELQQGTSHKQIRKLAHCGAEKVQRVQNLINSNAPDIAFYGEIKRGRPTKMTPEMIEELIQKGVGIISDRDLAASIQTNFNVKISRSTINLYRHKLHFEYKPPKQRQELTEEQKMKRKQFVYSIFNIPSFPWRSIIFSDESRICLKNDSKWVWRRRGDKCKEVFAEKSKYSKGIMVYGAIGHNYKSKLVFTSIKITSEVYTGNLELSGMFQDLQNRNYVFMQDGAPCHTSTKTKEWLHSRCDLLVFWPANSPDLNPIEMLWGIIKINLNQSQIKPKNIDELKRQVQEIWDSINMKTINKLIESFYYRLILVATHNGDSIQPYYRHNERVEKEFQQKAQEFLQKKEEDIVLLEQKDLIWKRERTHPSPGNFKPILQLEEQDLSRQEEEFIRTRRRIKWTKEEDDILFQSYRMLGPNWKLIAKKLPRRTIGSIRQRYLNLYSLSHFGYELLSE